MLTFSEAKKIGRNAYIERLEKIARLENGWDGEDARAFDGILIDKVKDILMGLNIQPEVFPTSCDSIQIEYECDSGSYLEFEISNDSNANDENGEETCYFIKANSQELARVEKELLVNQSLRKEE